MTDSGAERAARRVADDLDRMCKKHDIELKMFPTCLARWAAIIQEETGTRCWDCDHLVNRHQPHGYGGCDVLIGPNGQAEYCPCNLNAEEAAVPPAPEEG